MDARKKHFPALAGFIVLFCMAEVRAQAPGEAGIKGANAPGEAGSNWAVPIVGTATERTSPVAMPPDSADPFLIPDLTRLFPASPEPENVSASIQVIVLLTVLTLIPSILVMVTSFPRIIIVLALLRQAVGAPQLPPGQVLLALSLFITVIVMAPTWHRVQAEAVTPYLEGRLGQRAAFDAAASPLRDFMHRQIQQAGNEAGIYMFLEYAENREIPADEEIDLDSLPLTVLIPAFMLSELKTGFVMGFRIYLPFLVIDMVIATILLSMGMMMLPPVLISLPFKILLFVLADGWHLVVETLLHSFV